MCHLLPARANLSGWANLPLYPTTSFQAGRVNGALGRVRPSASCSAVTRAAASGGIQPFEAGVTMDDREDPDGDRNGSEQEIGGMSWKPSDRSAHARFAPPRPAPPRPAPPHARTLPPRE